MLAREFRCIESFQDNIHSERTSTSITNENTETVDQLVIKTGVVKFMN